MKSLFHPQKKLSIYIDGRLSPQEVDKLLAHVENCPSCKNLLEKMTAMRRLWKEKPTLTVRDDFVAKVVALYQGQQSKATFWLGFEQVPQLLPQLALVLMLILALLWRSPYWHHSISLPTNEMSSKATLLDETEWVADLTTYDQALLFALYENAENSQGDTK